MANYLLIDQLREHYNNNLERYVLKHPGEYILIGTYFEESFYKTKLDLDSGIEKKYGSIYGSTFLGTQIPKEMPDKKD
jgi:hypothetical protein